MDNQDLELQEYWDRASRRENFIDKLKKWWKAFSLSSNERKRIQRILISEAKPEFLANLRDKKFYNHLTKIGFGYNSRINTFNNKDLLEVYQAFMEINIPNRPKGRGIPKVS